MLKSLKGSRSSLRLGFVIFLIFGLVLLIIWSHLLTFARNCGTTSSKGSWRLLLFTDPQIEGDARVKREGFYGKLNNYYNDYYMRYVVDSVLRSTHPNAVAVLGDLFSFQFLSDSEFTSRVERYRWIFNNIPPNVFFINVSGNHDLGYGFEISEKYAKRFERSFGPLNAVYPIRIEKPKKSQTAIGKRNHSLVVLNSMVLDPTLNKKLSQDAWKFLANLESSNNVTILLTHIPLHKPRSVCVDVPQVILTKSGYVEEQTTLSPNVTHYVLNKIKPKIVFNGHDHEGCSYRHNEKTLEYTVRSIMGDYGGFSALFELKEDIVERDDGSTYFNYDYEIVPCSFIRLKILSLVLLVTASYLLFLIVFVLSRVFLFCFSFGKGSGKEKGSKIN